MRTGLFLAVFSLLFLSWRIHPAAAEVVINEIMYNSDAMPDIEFVELYNSGPAEVNLTGWFLLDDDLAHTPCPLVGLLAPGEYLVVASDNADFATLYPGVSNLNINAFDSGGEGFGLGNSGDTVNLFADEDELHDTVTYDDSSPWPGSPDGSGPSLELINPTLDNEDGGSWDPSLAAGGTPGAPNSAFSLNVGPTAKDGTRDIRLPTVADAVTVTAVAYDPEGLASVDLLVDLGSGFVAQPMFDDGAHGDGAPADSVFGAVIPAQPTDAVVRYYVVATDDVGQLNTWPSEAPANYRAYTVDHERPLLVINEILASNIGGAVDELGDLEDWVEIFNPGSVTVDLGGMFLSDDFDDRHKWEFPAGINLAPGGFLIVWADNETTEGPLHANFRLSNGGEEIGLYDAEDLGNAKLHGFKYGPVADNVSIGFQPDLGAAKSAHFSFGYSPEYLADPTPGTRNGPSALFSDVCINEFHSTGIFGGVDDWVELYNRGGVTVDLGGMYLSDNRSDNLKFQIPDGTLLPSGGFVVFNEVDMGFGFSSAGEVIMFTAADGSSGLDFYDYGEQISDITEGRYPDGEGTWYKLASSTPGVPNQAVTAVGDDIPASSPVLLVDVRAAPNPFNPRTEIHFTLGRAADVTVGIHDLSGRLVTTLHSGPLSAGPQVKSWAGRDARGRRQSSGSYFARIRTGSAQAVQKLLLLK